MYIQLVHLERLESSPLAVSVNLILCLNVLLDSNLLKSLLILFPLLLYGVGKMKHKKKTVQLNTTANVNLNNKHTVVTFILYCQC